MPYTPSDIVSFVSGTYTPGAETALRNAVNVINAAWNQANIKEDAFSTKMSAISTTWLGTAVAPQITAPAPVSAPTVVEPGVSIPATQEATDVMDLFDTKYTELVTMLAGKFSTFQSTYFPDDGVAYAAVEDWLQAAVANPDAGLPPALVTQLLDDDRARVLIEANRTNDAMLATFATRRFPLPPGASASAALQIQQKAQDEIADASRKIILASIDQVRFAIDKSIGLRQVAMGSAVDYVKAIAAAPEMASRLVGIGYDAQSKLISAASSFYGARIEAAKLISGVGQFNATTALQVSERNQSSDLQLVEDRLKALLAEAQVLGQMATSLFNNLHASAGTSYGVSVS